MVGMSIGEELLEERRRRRRAGDPRITPEGRAILARLVDGDLVGEFQAALDAVSAADPPLGGGDDDITDWPTQPIVIVIDESLAVRVALGRRPAGLRRGAGAADQPALAALRGPPQRTRRPALPDPGAPF